MTGRFPRPLRDLLAAESDEVRTRAWERFVGKHNRLLLKVAFETKAGYDRAMDRYAFTLEGLRADDFRRLRQYRPDGTTRFTTWLVVVARRLCLDHDRTVYGRPRRADDRLLQEHQTRRRLVDLVAEEIDLETLTTLDSLGTDARVRRREVREALETSLATLELEDRLLLRLRFEDAAPVSDIARLLEMPTVFHVYRRIRKVLSRLRAELETHGVDGSRP